MALHVLYYHTKHHAGAYTVTVKCDLLTQVENCNISSAHSFFHSKGIP